MLNAGAHRKVREPRPDVAANTNFLPSAHKKMALSTEIMERMYFQTSTQRALRDHSQDPEAARLAMGVSMKAVCSPAQSMKRYSSVPGVTEADCTSKREFGAKSLAAVPINNELRQMITKNNREGDVVRQNQGKLLSLSSETTTKAHYPPREVRLQDMAASAARKRQDRRLTIDPDAKLLERESSLHRAFAPKQDGNWCRPEPAKPWVNQSPFPQPEVAFAARDTSYKREFSDRTQLRHMRRQQGGRSGTRSGQPSPVTRRTFDLDAALLSTTR